MVVQVEFPSVMKIHLCEGKANAVFTIHALNNRIQMAVFGMK